MLRALDAPLLSYSGRYTEDRTVVRVGRLVGPHVVFVLQIL